LALVVSQRYGFQLRSNDQDNARIFTSLASLTEHIAAHASAEPVSSCKSVSQPASPRSPWLARPMCRLALADDADTGFRMERRRRADADAGRRGHRGLAQPPTLVAALRGVGLAALCAQAAMA